MRLNAAAARVETALEEAKLGATTASLRETSDSVGHAAANVSDVREELSASLQTLRETLDSVRALSMTLERDPSTLIRGPRGDGAAPGRSR